MEYKIIRRHVLALKKLGARNAPKDLLDEMATQIAEAIQLQAPSDQTRSLDLFKRHILQYAIIREKEGWYVRPKLHKVRRVLSSKT